MENHPNERDDEYTNIERLETEVLELDKRCQAASLTNQLLRLIFLAEVGKQLAEMDDADKTKKWKLKYKQWQ